MKLCLHWPSDRTGERKLAYHELSASQKEAVRRCSKSQVAVIARLVRDGETEPLYVARYANCFRGNTDANVHAEEFLLTDAAFLGVVANLAGGEDDAGTGEVCVEAASGEVEGEQAGDGEDGLGEHETERKQTQTRTPTRKPGAVRLLLYMTYQPCHHSGGRVPRNAMAKAVYVEQMPEHSITCSERLRDWHLAVLQPKGVQLSLILADVYKAT